MRKYSEYKPFNSQSVTSIPKHWSFNKFKRVSYMKGRIGWQGLKQSEFLEDKTLPFLITGMNFKEGLIKWEEVYHISEDRYEEAPEIQLKRGDVLMTKDGTIGKLLFINELPGKASLNSHLLVFRPLNKAYNTRFLYYQLQTEYFLDHIELTKTGTTFFGISQEACGQYITILPPEKEQTQIANYLDHKTTQIDTLIAKKQQFISLLQEERTAVINQAVTKGLDPKVKMKDSGIEWLGEIPEHWEVKRLRNLVDTIKTGSTPPSEEIQYFEPKEINWYGPGDFDSLILGDSKRKISKLAIDEKKCRLFPANSILLIGIGATVGKVGLAVEDCSSNQQLNAIILKNNYNPIFYLYFLSTIKDIIVMEASSATLPIFNQTQTKNIITPVPPAKEQLEISNYIKNQEIRIETLISKSKQEIELLKEYKTALISEVVTGKVDVRGVVLN